MLPPDRRSVGGAFKYVVSRMSRLVPAMIWYLPFSLILYTLLWLHINGIESIAIHMDYPEISIGDPENDVFNINTDNAVLHYINSWTGMATCKGRRKAPSENFGMVPTWKTKEGKTSKFEDAAGYNRNERGGELTTWSGSTGRGKEGK
jgi:hypothetical protein